MIDLVLAHCAVTDLEAAEQWYRRVFGSAPDTRPMDGLIEWRFGFAHGVQVFRDADRAGGSTVVVGLSDLEQAVARMERDGIDHRGIQPGGGGRLTMLSDPDGNRVVLLDRAASTDIEHPAPELAHTTLRFERTIAAPVGRVWAAYAVVEQRAVWSVPDGEAVVHDGGDFTVGGVDAHRCGRPDDLATHVTTRYRHIDAPRSFVAINELRRDSREVAIDITHWRLDPDADETTVTIVVQVTSLAGAGMLDGYRNGHEHVLDRLEQYVT